MPGRKQKTDREKNLQGNPGNRPLDTSTTPRVRNQKMNVPRYLDDEAKKEWRRIVQELRDAGLLTGIDRAGLVAYCQAWSTYKKCWDQLNEQELTLVTSKGYHYQNPLLGIANKAQEIMRQWAREFGMTPDARNRVKAESPDEDDPFENFLKGR